MASIPVQYVARTGEAFGDAVRRLAKECHVSKAACMLGFASARNLQLAMEARGITAEFQPYTRPRKEKPPAEWSRITADEVDRYVAARLSGKTASQAAATLGRQRAAMWHAACRMRPDAIQAMSAAGQVNRKRARGQRYA